MSAPGAAGGPSPLEAGREAFEHTRAQLFPFRLERWWVLGFLAFLDQCGRGAWGWSGPNHSSGRGRGGGPDLERTLAWVSAHLGLAIGLLVLALGLVVALTALILWLNSRGIFMYIDAVATGRGEVRRPWREHKEAASSLFAWRFALALVLLLLVMLLLAGALAVLAGVSRGGALPASWPAWLVLGALILMLPPVLLSLLAEVALRDFVAPLMLLGRSACGPAARAFLDLLCRHPGAFAIYLLLKIVFTLVAGTLVLVACCLTCCLALVPVVSQTLLQPVFFFERAWSLALLRRMGRDLFASFPGHAVAAPPA